MKFMNESSQVKGTSGLNQEMTPSPCDRKSGAGADQLRRFALAVGFLTLCFAFPLWELIRFAVSSQLYSYILLVPWISLYLVWRQWGTLPVVKEPARANAGVFLLAGAVVVLAGWGGLRFDWGLVRQDYLTIMTIAFLLCFFGVCHLFWGKETWRAVAFPLWFLLFLVPIPAAVIRWIDAGLQEGSAVVAGGLFWLSGTPYLQDGLMFQLPGIGLQIAPECSGIHSTLVLVITSLLAGHLFLRSPWKRAVLLCVVIPLGLIRNGFRVFTIGMLCVHIGPQMIHSYIHRKGGPIFFMLSLIPLFALLVAFHKSETRRGKNGMKKTGAKNA